MSEQFLELLKFLFLALLYAFFVWVVIMSLIQLRKPKKSIRSSKKDKDHKTAITHLLTIEPQDIQGTEYPLEEEIFVGRDEECDVIINDSFTSHRHARIYLEDNTLFLEDLASTNGTFVNGEKIEKIHLLEKRDRIQIGNTVLEAK